MSGTLIYLVSNVLNAAIPFALLPVLTRVLDPSEYGQVAMFQTLLAARRVVGRIAVAVVTRSRALLRILLCYESAPLLWCYASCTARIHRALLRRINDEEIDARASICTTIAQL